MAEKKTYPPKGSRHASSSLLPLTPRSSPAHSITALPRQSPSPLLGACRLPSSFPGICSSRSSHLFLQRLGLRLSALATPTRTSPAAANCFALDRFRLCAANSAQHNQTSTLPGDACSDCSAFARLFDETAKTLSSERTAVPPSPLRSPPLPFCPVSFQLRPSRYLDATTQRTLLSQEHLTPDKTRLARHEIL